MTATSKTIPFEKIKGRAIEIATGRLSRITSLTYAPDEAAGVTFDINLAYHTLLPALKHAQRDGVVPQEMHAEINELLVQAVAHRIDHWDVRSVNQLVDLFPEAVPANCRLRHASADYGSGDDWVVTFDLTQRRQRSHVPNWPELRAVAFLGSPAPWRLMALLPEIKDAQDAYNAAFEAITGNLTAIDADARLQQATAAFNATLARAAAAFYLDTAGYNHWDTIQQVYSPDRKGQRETTLWFVEPHESSRAYAQLEKIAQDLESQTLEDALRDQARDLSAATDGPERTRQRG